MPASSPVPFPAGFRLIDGNDLNAQLGKTSSSETGITAFAGGGQAGAYQLSAANNKVATVATTADSVKLPPAKAGLEVQLRNSGANSMQVFGISPDTINGVATGTGVAQAAGLSASYFCPADGEWFRILSA